MQFKENCLRLNKGSMTSCNWDDTHGSHYLKTQNTYVCISPHSYVCKLLLSTSSVHVCGLGMQEFTGQFRRFVSYR